MLVLTIQKKSIAQKIINGNYKADFWKSSFSCISPRFTSGYNICKNELENKLGKSFSEDFSPIWAWVGYPYIKFHTYLYEGDLVALFLDVPASEMVFSDYDKYCDYIYGESTDKDFMLGFTDARNAGKRNRCVQACLESINPNNILLTVDFIRFNGEMKSIENFYNYIRLVNVYVDLKKKVGKVSLQGSVA